MTMWNISRFVNNQQKLKACIYKLYDIIIDMIKRQPLPWCVKLGTQGKLDWMANFKIGKILLGKFTRR